MRWVGIPKYTAKLTVPTTATRDEPIKADLDVSQGRISQVSVTWTPGSEWLNPFRALYEGGQVIPSEGGGLCRGAGYPDVWVEHIILDKSHPTLNLEAWNEGNDYEQDVLVSVVVLPLEPDLMSPIRDLISLIKRLIGL